MIQVKVKNIGIDAITGSPILMLANIDNENEIFPIWIGVSEAEGIIIKQSGIKTPRPLTYELVKNIIESLNAKVKQVNIIDYKDGAYIAQLILLQSDKEIEIDARPSDAINIALRFDAPIFVNEQIVKKVDIKHFSPEAKEQITNQKFEPNVLTNYINEENKEIDKELEEFRKMLDKIKPEDFANPDL